MDYDALPRFGPPSQPDKHKVFFSIKDKEKALQAYRDLGVKKQVKIPGARFILYYVRPEEVFVKYGDIEAEKYYAQEEQMKKEQEEYLKEQQIRMKKTKSYPDERANQYDERRGGAYPQRDQRDRQRKPRKDDYYQQPEGVEGDRRDDRRSKGGDRKYPDKAEREQLQQEESVKVFE